MIAIAVAIIAALGSVVAAYLASSASSRARGHESKLEDLRRDYAELQDENEACLRDRRNLKQLVQLIAGAFVGLLPERERLVLLRAIDETVHTEDAA